MFVIRRGKGVIAANRGGEFTASGSATVAARQSVWLDGVDDHYTYADASSLDYPDGNWTVAALVKLDYVTATKIQYIFNHGNTGGAQNIQLFLNGQTLTGTARTSGSASTATLAGFTNNTKWYVLGIRRNGTNVEVFSCEQGGTISVSTATAINTPAVITPSGTAYVGARFDLSSTRFFGNNISYIFKCNGTVSNANIEALAAGQDIITDLALSPSLYTKFDSGSTISDSSGNSNTATKVGAPAVRGGPDFSGLPVRISSASSLGFGRVYQRDIGGTSASVTFTGSYNGAPSGIEARVVDRDGTQVVGWTAATSPSAGNWSVTVPSIPQGNNYALEVRWTNNTANIQRTPLPWGVGVVIFGTGQSNMENMKTDNTARAIDGVTMSLFDMDEYDAAAAQGGWRDVRSGSIGAGFGEAAFQIQGALAGSNIPVCLVNAAWSGSALTGSGGWQDTASSPWQRFLTAVSVVGKGEAVAWFQGEADANNNVAQATYETDLATVVGRMRSTMGLTAAQLPFLCWILGKQGSVSGNIWPPIRSALMASIGSITNAKHVGGAYDLVLVDALHYDSTSYARLGNRLAQAFLNYLLPGTYTTGCNGPAISSATFSGSVVTINFTLNDASGIAMTGTGNITGLVVKNAADATQTISSTAIVGSTVELTMSGSPATGWKVEYWNLDAYTGTNHLVGTMSVIGDTRGVPVKPTTSAIVM
jgi:hypothetical protein